MKTIDACLFLAVGLFMQLAPLLAPEWFPATGPGRASGSALWLMFMGGVNESVGAFTLVCRQILPRLDALFAWRPRLTNASAAEIPRSPLPIGIPMHLHQEAIQRAVA